MNFKKILLISLFYSVIFSYMVVIFAHKKFLLDNFLGLFFSNFFIALLTFSIRENKKLNIKKQKDP